MVINWKKEEKVKEQELLKNEEKRRKAKLAQTKSTESEQIMIVNILFSKTAKKERCHGRILQKANLNQVIKEHRRIVLTYNFYISRLVTTVKENRN